MFDMFLSALQIAHGIAHYQTQEKGEAVGLLNAFRYTATRCGHRTRRKGKVSAFGRTITTEMPMNKSTPVDYCLRCIGKMAIRCAWCGEPIFIGDPITLYTPRGDFKVPEHTVVYSKNRCSSSAVSGGIAPTRAQTALDSGCQTKAEKGMSSGFRPPSRQCPARECPPR